MKILNIILLMMSPIILLGQSKLDKMKAEVVEEGKRLYNCEMSAWNGTDLFLSKYKEQENIGGYLTYNENSQNICLFYDRSTKPVVIGTIRFNEEHNTESAEMDFEERNFTDYELDLYDMRVSAQEQLESNGIFKFYKDTRPNIIPLISNNHKKVYILTAPQKSGIVILGNDYLIEFDKKNQVKKVNQIHNNILEFNYTNQEDNMKLAEGVHSHLPSTGEIITPTDICTLMLYSKYAGWKSPNVVSKKYLSIWNCETNELSVVSMKGIKNIDKKN